MNEIFEIGFKKTAGVFKSMADAAYQSSKKARKVLTGDDFKKKIEVIRSQKPIKPKAKAGTSVLTPKPKVKKVNKGWTPPKPRPTAKELWDRYQVKK